MADPGRFEQIYDLHVVAIHRFIYARVGNRPDAEDLTAQVFVRALEQLEVDRPAGQIRAWLYRVAQNAVADYWRAFYRLPQVDMELIASSWAPMPTADKPAVEADDERAASTVAALLKRLPEQYARVLDLRFLQRLSVAETADRLGVSHGNAKVLQHRALRRAAMLGATDG